MGFNLPTDMIVTIATVVFASSGFWSYLQSRDVLNRRKKEEQIESQKELVESINLIKTGTMFMLRNDLLKRIDKLLDTNVEDIDLKTIDNIRVEYNTYRQLNGNSDVITRWELLMDKINNHITNSN